MDDSFKVRADRIFGALGVTNSSPASSFSSPMSATWRLVDHKIERKESKREEDPNHEEGVGDRKDDETTYDLANDLDELDSEVEPDSDSSTIVRPAEYNDEEWEIKSAIGQDCTLDYEEEEDAYDKVAVGREQMGDRLYMKEFSDYGIDINCGSELPTSLKKVPRDSRANHTAAMIRLKEDADEASKIDSVHGLGVNTPSSGIEGQSLEENAYLRPILKRKDGQLDSKVEKRVRFDPQFMEEESPDWEGRSCTAIGTPTKVGNDSAVPDYIRNPSRYTHYTFGSSNEMDEQSNRQSKTSQEQEDTIVDLPKSIAFVPKKKAGSAADIANFTGPKYDDNGLVKEAAQRRGFPTGIVSGDTQDGEMCAMEEDQPEKTVARTNPLNKSGRQYRTKGLTEGDE